MAKDQRIIRVNAVVVIVLKNVKNQAADLAPVLALVIIKRTLTHSPEWTIVRNDKNYDSMNIQQKIGVFKREMTKVIII